MKKTLMASLLAATLLAACDDSKEVASEASAVAPKSLSAEERAEKTFMAATEASEKYYQTFLTSHPLIKTIEYKVESYEKGENSAKATTMASVHLNTEIDGKKAFGLMLSHDIHYDKAVLDAGLISKTVSTVAKPQGLSEEAEKVLAVVEKNFRYTTEISNKELLTQHMTIDPFTATEDGKTLTFKGLDTTYQTSLSEMADGFGDMTLAFKGAEDNDGFAIGELNAKGYYKKNGDMHFETTSPFTAGDGEGSFSIAQVTFNGNLLRNEKFNLMVGNGEMQFNNIGLNSPEMPTALTIDNVTSSTTTSISDKEILKQTSKITIKPAQNLVSQLSQGMLDVSEVNANAVMDNLPAQVIVDYQDFIGTLFADSSFVDGEKPSEEAKAAAVEKGKVMFDSAKAAGAKMDIDVALKSSDGDTTANFNMQMNSDRLLALDAQIKIPAVLVEKTGAQMMAGPYLQKNGDFYEAKLTNENGMLLINGNPAPLPF